MESFDLTILGAGPGGYVAAIRAAQLGLKVALVEKEPTLGGTCLNVGCIPSKMLLESSELYACMQHKVAQHGVLVEGQVTLDLPTMMQRKARAVKELTDGIALLMKKNKVAVIRGQGSLLSSERLQIQSSDGSQEVSSRHILLATGSHPVELPFMPFDDQTVVSSTGALSFSEVPQQLVVIGAGAVGLELGSVWARLGARVTVVEMMPQIVPFADGQMAKTLHRSLKQQGLDIRLKTKVVAADPKDGQVQLTLQDAKDQRTELSADRVLVAVGRRPSSEGLGLTQVGVTRDEGGRVIVDQELRTAVPTIFAIGDLIAGPMLAHKAEEEGVAVAERIAGKPGHVNYEVIPNIVYTFPELAGVGLTEEQLKERQQPYRSGRFLFRANGRAKSLGEEEGMVKILADERTDRLLGVHIVGARASEMIAEAVVAMEFKASAEDLARTVHAHPTLAEIMKEAALAVDQRSIHS